MIMLNVARMRRRGVHSLQCCHPTLPVTTQRMAAYLRLSVSHLLHIHRLGIGPANIAPNPYRGRSLYWRLADGLSWRLRVCGRPERSPEEILSDWKKTNAPFLKSHPQLAIVADWSENMADGICCSEACKAFHCDRRCEAAYFVSAILPPLKNKNSVCRGSR